MKHNVIPGLKSLKDCLNETKQSLHQKIEFIAFLLLPETVEDSDTEEEEEESNESEEN